MPFEVYMKLKLSNIIWRFLCALQKKSKMANTLSSDFFIAQFCEAFTWYYYSGYK